MMGGIVCTRPAPVSLSTHCAVRVVSRSGPGHRFQISWQRSTLGLNRGRYEKGLALAFGQGDTTKDKGSVVDHNRYTQAQTGHDDTMP